MREEIRDHRQYESTKRIGRLNKQNNFERLPHILGNRLKNSIIILAKVESAYNFIHLITLFVFVWTDHL